MEELIKKYDDVMSLGFNCYFKLLFKKVYTECDKENQFFDYAGSPMWAVNELVKNDFKNIFNRDDYKPIKVWQEKEQKLIGNIKYDSIFRHDFIKEPNYFEFNFFRQKYVKRRARFYNRINSNKKILLCRLEEHRIGRNDNEVFRDKYKKSELEYLRDFQKILKEKYPRLNYHILYVSYTEPESKVLENEKIIILKMDPFDNSSESEFDLKERLDKGKEFLKNINL